MNGTRKPASANPGRRTAERSRSPRRCPTMPRHEGPRKPSVREARDLAMERADRVRWHRARGWRTLARVSHADPELDPHAAVAKAALRREILARRDALDPRVRARLSEAALERTQALDAFGRARVVFGYASFGSELDTWPLLQQVLASGRTLVLPRVDREARRLVLHEVRDLHAELRPGTWGIPEPDSGALPSGGARRDRLRPRARPRLRPGRRPHRLRSRLLRPAPRIVAGAGAARSWRRRSSSRSSRRCRSSPRTAGSTSW